MLIGVFHKLPLVPLDVLLRLISGFYDEIKKAYPMLSLNSRLQEITYTIP